MPSKKSKRERKIKIPVGGDYQAVLPPFIHETDRSRADQSPERSLLAWSPATNISDTRRKSPSHHADLSSPETLISRDIESIETTTFVCCCLLCLFCFFLPGLPRAADEVAYKQSRAVQAEHWTGSLYLPAKQK